MIFNLEDTEIPGWVLTLLLIGCLVAAILAGVGILYVITEA